MEKRVYCLGFFDAVHVGHRRLISRGVEIASEMGSKPVVVTFGDGLYSALSLNTKEIYLLRERRQLITELGAEILVLPTNKEFFDKSVIDFLYYLKSLMPSAIVCGADYTFGKNALGNANTLCDFFSDIAPVKIVDILKENGKKISTTYIRELLSDGKIEEANKLLFKPFFIDGKVVNGRAEGRKIGIPTANIEIENTKFIPKYGVYATKTVVDGLEYLSVTNVGGHPTFCDEHVNVETHIIDFNGDIYNKNIKLSFYKYLRNISEFSSKYELINTIKNDIISVKKELLL